MGLSCGAMTTFSPAPLLGGPHAQTLYAALLRRVPLDLARERLTLPDGDFLDIDVARPETPAAGAPWAAILHGLEGSAASPYARGMGRALVQRGVEAVLVNYRGCSGEPNALARTYHSGESGDVREALRQLAAARPGRPFAVAGFSIGANLTMKLLGEAAAPEGLVAAAAVSPPFDLAAASRHLDRPGAYVYREHMLASLRDKSVAKARRFPSSLPPERDIRRCRTFLAFDERVTAPLHGFVSAADYYAKSSGGAYLEAIARPLLVVVAADDPFFPAGFVPRAALAKNPNVRLVVTPRGGHVGFVGGSALAPRYWAEAMVADELLARLSAGSSSAASERA